MATPLNLSVVDRLLTTTRSVRKRLDFTRPVPPEIVQECLEIAVQAPTGSNAQGWHFLVVTGAEKRAAIGDYYSRSFRDYLRSGRSSSDRFSGNDARAVRAKPVTESAIYLARHMREVPLMVIPCIEGRVESPAPAAVAGLYGSILPATWSLMLALRARGLGAAWTTLHLVYEREVAQLLSIPDTMTQVALLPVAYYTGDDFRPAARIPARERTYWDTWGVTR
jgi:nitroreductase